MRQTIDTVEQYWSRETLEAACRTATDHSIEEFTHQLKNFLEAPESSVELFLSGRRALEWILRSCQGERTRVMVPMFNCGVVGDAIKNAGFEAWPYDFAERAGCFDWSRIADDLTTDVAAVIVTHYYGVPQDFRCIARACADLSIPIIEDCAHTLGGVIGDTVAGTLGDAAIFSFNYDKPIALGWGGAAVVNDRTLFGDAITTNDYSPLGFDDEIRLLRRFLVMNSVRRGVIPYQKTAVVRLAKKIAPEIKKRLLGGGSGPDFAIGAVQAEIGRRCLADYPEIVEARNRNARVFAREYRKATWPEGGTVTPAWLRQKVYLGDGKKRAKGLSALHRQGIRVDNLNWPRLLQRQGSVSVGTALEVSRDWVDVPVHQNISEEEVRGIAQALNEI